MTYENIVKGTFINRPNRFIASVQINGTVETVHVKNTGRCKELLIKGATVYLQKSNNPNRKTAYDLIAVKKGDLMIVNPDTLHSETSVGGKFGVYIIGIENYVLQNPLGAYEPISLTVDRVGYYLEQLFLDYESQNLDFIENITCLFSLIINDITQKADYTPQRLVKSSGNEVTNLIKKYID